MEARRDFVVREHHRVKAVAALPPWERGMTSEERIEYQAQKVVEKELCERNTVKKQIWVSIMLLLLIASGVVWLKYKTREVDQ